MAPARSASSRASIRSRRVSFRSLPGRGGEITTVCSSIGSVGGERGSSSSGRFHFGRINQMRMDEVNPFADSNVRSLPALDALQELLEREYLLEALLQGVGQVDDLDGLP